MESMAAPSRRQAPSLKQHLFDRCYEFDFHQAVKILSFIYPNHDPLWDGGTDRGEMVSFTSRIAYAYSPSDIYALECTDKKGPPVRMTVNFMGLAGAVGPLPTALTDQIVDRLKQSDTAARDFLDIFNHRLLSLFHGIHQKYTIGVGRQDPSDTVLGRCLGDVVGIGVHAQQNRLGVKDRSLLKYGGVFWTRTRSCHGLGTILSDYFSIPVKSQDLEGGWTPLPKDSQTILTPQNQNTVLGETATLGRRTWDQTRFVRLRLGPLTWGQFQSFLPGGAAFKPFQDLTFFYLNYQHVRFHYVIKASEIKPSTLGSTSRLGFDSFLKTRPFLHDDDQVCVTVPPPL